MDQGLGGDLGPVQVLLDQDAAAPARFDGLVGAGLNQLPGAADGLFELLLVVDADNAQAGESADRLHHDREAQRQRVRPVLRALQEDEPGYLEARLAQRTSHGTLVPHDRRGLLGQAGEPEGLRGTGREGHHQLVARHDSVEGVGAVALDEGRQRVVRVPFDVQGQHLGDRGGLPRRFDAGSRPGDEHHVDADPLGGVEHPRGGQELADENYLRALRHGDLRGGRRLRSESPGGNGTEPIPITNDPPHSLSCRP